MQVAHLALMICLNSRARAGHANTERLGCVKNACYALSCFASASDGHALVLRLDDDERSVPDTASEAGAGAAAATPAPSASGDRSGDGAGGPLKEPLVVDHSPAAKSVRFVGEAFGAGAGAGAKQPPPEPLQSPGRSKKVRLFRHLAEELLHIVTTCRDDETVWFAAVYAAIVHCSLSLSHLMLYSLWVFDSTRSSADSVVRLSPGYCTRWRASLRGV